MPQYQYFDSLDVHCLEDILASYLSVFHKKLRRQLLQPSKYETDLRIPKKTSANGQKCISHRGAKLWNSLPAETKQASSIAVFRQTIRWGGGLFLQSSGWPRPAVSVLDCCFISNGDLFSGSPVVGLAGSGVGTGAALVA